MEEAKRAWWKKNQQAKATATRSTTKYNNSDMKPYSAGQAFMTHIAGEKQLGIWYLNFCMLRHICNSKDKFSDLQAITYKFVMAGEDIIWSE